MPELEHAETYLAISDLERARGRARRRVGELADLLRLRRPARILDAGAGQGWYSLLLARAHDVVGIDASRDLIAEARRRSAHLAPGPAPALIVAPSQKVPLADGVIDVALSLSGSIGYDGADGDRATLAELRRVLAPDGRLLLETSHGEGAVAADRVAVFPGGASVHYRPRLEGTMLHETQTLVRRGVELGRFEYTLQIWDVAELLALLREAGLAPESVYGATDGSNVGGSPSLVITARPQPAAFSLSLGHGPVAAAPRRGKGEPGGR